MKKEPIINKKRLTAFWMTESLRRKLRLIQVRHEFASMSDSMRFSINKTYRDTCKGVTMKKYIDEGPTKEDISEEVEDLINKMRRTRIMLESKAQRAARIRKRSQRVNDEEKEFRDEEGI